MAHLLAVAFPIELRRHRWNALQGGQVQQGEVTTAVRQPSADIDVVHVAQHGRLAQRRVADDNGKDVLHEAVSFYDLEIGHVGWYPFASLDQLSTLYEAPAAILGDGVARASVYPAVAASGRQVEVSVAAEAGASSEATTPQIVSYGGEFRQNRMSRACCQGIRSSVPSSCGPLLGTVRQCLPILASITTSPSWGTASALPGGRWLVECGVQRWWGLD